MFKRIRLPKFLLILALILAACQASPASPVPSVETLVVTECFKQSAWAEDDYRFWHSRDRTGTEVDPVVESSAGKIVGVEVKASATIKLEDFRGLVHLADYAGEKMHRGVVFYSGANLLPVRVAGLTFHAVPLSYLGVKTP